MLLMYVNFFIILGAVLPTCNLLETVLCIYGIRMQDKDGTKTKLNDRAEAMATYLEEVHWGNEATECSSKEDEGTKLPNL